MTDYVASFQDDVKLLADIPDSGTDSEVENVPDDSEAESIKEDEVGFSSTNLLLTSCNLLNLSGLQAHKWPALTLGFL